MVASKKKIIRGKKVKKMVKVSKHSTPKKVKIVKKAQKMKPSVKAKKITKKPAKHSAASRVEKVIPKPKKAVVKSKLQSKALKKGEKKKTLRREPVKTRSVMKKNTKKAQEIRGAMMPGEKVINNIGIEGIDPYIPKARENYMSAGMREHFRRILLAWKRQLMEEADRTVQHMQDESTNYPDPSDRATQEEEFNLELRARDRERKLIKKIEDALFMLDEGTYGFCEACGEEIGLRRLEARPTATLCIDCKTLDEIREKQQSG